MLKHLKRGLCQRHECARVSRLNATVAHGDDAVLSRQFHARVPSSRPMPKGFYLLLCAQFASALADNALLIVTIALLQSQGFALWWAPLLKFSFTISYVVLAPFVGPLADAMPKARLMAFMNGVKIIGVLALIAGVHPLLAFAVVGFGAAAYAPAKYGLITELVGAEGLVKANGWLEVSVVGAALLGAILGGVLVSPWCQASGAVQHALALLEGHGWAMHGPLGVSLAALLSVYALSSALNLRVPRSGATYPPSTRDLPQLLQEFWQAQTTLWRDTEGGLSLTVTTLFWGVGATLQFAVLRWAADVLHLSMDHAAYLQGAVAVGVVLGAAAAGRWVALHQAKHMLVMGVLMGLLTSLAALTHSVPWAVALLCVVGAVGGLLVVPLNALLQHRGHTLLSAGRSIAVQGFNENASVLVMLAAYAGFTALGVHIVPLMLGFGLLIASAMAVLMWRARPLPAVEQVNTVA